MAAALRAALAPLAATPDSADATVVLPDRPPPPPHPAPTALTTGPTAAPTEFANLDAPTLATIERRLASHIGPMARHHLRHAMSRATSPEHLCELLAELVPAGKERTDLLAFMRTVVATAAPPPPPAPSPPAPASAPPPPPQDLPISDADTARFSRALAEIMGPIAPLLLRRALARADTLDALETACVALIDGPKEAARFRALLRGTSK